MICFKKIKSWINTPKWIREMYLKKYQCPVCKKRTVKERVCAIDHELGETYTEYYCSTCEKVIKDDIMFPEFYRYQKYKNKHTSEKVFAKVIDDDWLINWWNTKINSENPTNFVVGDYKIIRKGILSLISKKEFEKNYRKRRKRNEYGS